MVMSGIPGQWFAAKAQAQETHAPHSREAPQSGAPRSLSVSREASPPPPPPPSPSVSLQSNLMRLPCGQPWVHLREGRTAGQAFSAERRGPRLPAATPFAPIPKRGKAGPSQRAQTVPLPTTHLWRCSLHQSLSPACATTAAASSRAASSRADMQRGRAMLHGGRRRLAIGCTRRAAGGERRPAADGTWPAQLQAPARSHRLARRVQRGERGFEARGLGRRVHASGCRAGGRGVPGGAEGDRGCEPRPARNC